jgi:predicted nucleotidyltransferase component of viral defense system
MLDAAVHKSVLIRILKSIYGDMTVGPFVGFKGGTAAHLFYDLERCFSVDLDFDLLDASKKELVFEQLTKILTAHGTIKESRQKRYTLFFLLSYREGFQNIKVEVNCRDFGSRYEVKSYLGIPMKVMVREDMAM